MIYVHRLQDLTPKIADIESVSIIRKIKQQNQIPLNEEKVKSSILPYFVLKTDLDLIANALELIPPAIESIIELPKFGQQSLYVPLNLQRACSALNEVFNPLRESLSYSRQILEWQSLLCSQICPLLNKIPLLRTFDEKTACGKELDQIFEKILRNSEQFMFNSKNIIHEGPVSAITSLAESMSKGFFFHVNIDEHIQNLSFSEIRKRISHEELDKFDKISQNIFDIKKGVETAYKISMNMVQLAIIIYSYIKFMKDN